MQQSRTALILTRLIAFTVLAYGLVIIVGSFLRQLQVHGRHDIDALFVTLPLLIGLSYAYLGNLLLRRKYNAWITAVALSAVTVILNIITAVRPHFGAAPAHDHMAWMRIALPALILLLLVVSRSTFRVQSDMRSFKQALRTSVLVLLVALLYGVGGFTLLDKHDFHQEISLPAAIHQTVDQFGLTTINATPHTRRAKLFVGSLSVISTVAVAYAVISFFQPLRMRLTNQTRQRERAEELLREHPSDLDDYFKLWPHDKHYFFDTTETAGLAYHVARGVALVVGNPFGNPKRFTELLRSFGELCFVNDWVPSFIHVNEAHRNLYEMMGYKLQKIGEEAVLDLEAFEAEKNSKYFRQIRNRFLKLGYKVELLEPPHSAPIIRQLHEISDGWLQKPGREERGFMLGYFSEEYLQGGLVAVATDAEHKIQGFVNVVPTFEHGTANYDLLRCSAQAPGNCNDFLLLGLLEALHDADVQKLNLGLTPLAGLDSAAADATLVDNALKFLYSNGDRFYSFSGLRRFKAKYQPAWEPRYIAYPGGIRTFTRVITALNRAMKVK